MRTPILSALSAVLLTTCSTAFAGWTPDEMNTQIDQTNFVVNSGCSGTLVDLDNRYVLTANHCVTRQYETVVVEDISDDGTIKKREVRRVIPGTVKQIAFDGAFEVREITYRTKLVATDKSRDLAVVQILADIPNTVVTRLSCEFPVRGEPVYIVGNPAGLYSNVVAGIVSSVQRSYEMLQFGDSDSQDKPLMQVSGGIVGGNSGGAVYDATGELIGVSVLAHKVNEVIAFAVPIDSIKAFLTERKLSGIFSYCAENKEVDDSN